MPSISAASTAGASTPDPAGSGTTRVRDRSHPASAAAAIPAAG
ncbi:hypothetical protein [Promicromonospora sp. NFX87]